MRNFSWSLLCFLLLLLLTIPCFGSPLEPEQDIITVRMLLLNPDSYDQKIVVFSGELIGQMLYRQDGAWFHLRDHEDNLISVWANHEHIGPFSFFGRYGVQGDQIKLQGVYNKACPQHGGDTDIHLIEIMEHQEGYLLPPQAIASYKIYMLILLALLGIALWILEKQKRNQLPLD